MILALVLAIVVPFLPTLGQADGHSPIPRPGIGSGLWAIMFLEGSMCEPCEEALPWAIHAQEAFPEFRVVLSFPGDVQEVPLDLLSGLEFFIDADGAFGGDLSISYVPSLLVFASGRLLSRLEWPFSEGDLLRGIAEASITAPLLLSPSVLVGARAPAFQALDPSNAIVSSANLSEPYLLSFLSPDCPACWESLRNLSRVADAIPVVVLLVSNSRDLTEQQRAELVVYGEDSEQLSILFINDPETLRSYGISRTPTYFSIDAEGFICAAEEGYVARDELLLLQRCALSDETGTRQEE